MISRKLDVSMQRYLAGRFALANGFCDLECQEGVNLRTGVDIAEHLSAVAYSHVNQTVPTIFEQGEILYDCSEKVLLVPGEFGLEKSMKIPENSGKLGAS